MRGWEDGVASMQLNESARLHLPWQYACESVTGTDFEHAQLYLCLAFTPS